MCKYTLSTKHNAVYGLEDVVLALPHMCKNGTTANRFVTGLRNMFRDDKKYSYPDIPVAVGNDR